MEAIKLSENISMFDETLTIPYHYRVFSKLTFVTIFYDKNEKCFAVTRKDTKQIENIDDYNIQLAEAKNAATKANDYLQIKNRLVRNKIN